MGLDSLQYCNGIEKGRLVTLEDLEYMRKNEPLTKEDQISSPTPDRYLIKLAKSFLRVSKYIGLDVRDYLKNIFIRE
jgi:hypothetical protein